MTSHPQCRSVQLLVLFVSREPATITHEKDAEKAGLRFFPLTLTPQILSGLSSPQILMLELAKKVAPCVGNNGRSLGVHERWRF